jgi:hypothetical protein
VLSAMAVRPTVIAIVDGYFHNAPAVWHKEILWALSQGVRVIGGASMGALRAAELEPFGMEGAGRVFEAFRDGKLTDDDEVAVRHGPEEIGYPAVSEALVNIRATLAAAEARGTVAAGTRCRLEGIAKATFYPERSFGRLLADARRADLPAAELDALTAFLAETRVDQKRLDALELLGVVRERLGAGPPPRRSWRFENTEVWHALIQDVGQPEGSRHPAAADTPFWVAIERSGRLTLNETPHSTPCPTGSCHGAGRRASSIPPA